MKIAYFDCFSGISGDMVLGAWVDAGLELERLQAELARLPLSSYTLTAQTVRRGGLRGTQVGVQVTAQDTERHLSDIEAIIARSDLPAQVKEQSTAIFRRLGQAEAHVHGVPVDHVHFHEVGAIDAIVDIVGAAVGLWVLGIERVYASPLHVGGGTVECAHGTLPVPAPATLELLRGIPIYGGKVQAELVTPTGAAIVSTLAQGFGSAPAMQVAQVGYGAGSRELPLPNLLRVSIGTAVEEPAGYEEDTITVVEANVDDMNPQWYEHAMKRLFEAGALDVFLTPIQMKRGRPAVQISAMVPEERVQDVLAVLFAETTTIGVRLHAARRRKLAREHVTVQTAYGPVGFKVARRDGAVLNAAPEHRECLRLAEAQRVPLKAVYQAALAAWAVAGGGESEGAEEVE